MFEAGSGDFVKPFSGEVMTDGEVLYGFYKTEHASNGVLVDEWQQLEESERDAWEWAARKFGDFFEQRLMK